MQRLFRRTQCTTWVADQIVIASRARIMAATTPRHSIGIAGVAVVLEAVADRPRA